VASQAGARNGASVRLRGLVVPAAALSRPALLRSQGPNPWNLTNLTPLPPPCEWPYLHSGGGDIRQPLPH
jgi:hypothetical protein